MQALTPILIVVGTVAFMEGFAWWAHKYVMHRWGWGWHRSHHVPHEGLLEKNDLYAIFFASVSILLFLAGTHLWRPLWWVALGVTLYGLLYFVVHDGLVHGRWPFRVVPRRGYLKRLYQAHRLHHAVKGRDGCVSFGFLWAPPVTELTEELRQNRERHNLAMYVSEEEALREG